MVLLDNSFFRIPPLGRVLSPFSGVIQNENIDFNDQEIYTSVYDAVIHFDNRHIPHIFSKDESSLYFAQGFVTASDRLWQMDFLSYAAAGRLSEIFGENYLEYDRRQRRLGVLRSALETLDLMKLDSTTYGALTAYTAGVNQFIDLLTEATTPLEYKLLGYDPEPWSPLKSVLILKYMGVMLSGYEQDIQASFTYAAIGAEKFRLLFPNYELSDLDTFPNFEVARYGDSSDFNQHMDYSFLQSSPIASHGVYNPGLGSNAWAISSEKSKSGNAILCNDPHLNLLLPATWYELQMSVGDMNTYGYSIPGTPGIIIGFNQHISWGVTNGATDVKDWFKPEINYKDSTYLVDNEWISLDTIIERFEIKWHEPFYDTIFKTIFGPVVFDNNFGPEKNSAKNLCLHWTINDPSNEILTFLKLNKSKNYEDFQNALGHYKTPIQNFVYADKEGNVAHHHQGKLIYREQKGDGVFILDGTKSENLHAALEEAPPVVYNPKEGFVLNANNRPSFSDTSFSHGYYSDYRANRIRKVLSGSEKLDVQDMKNLQLDNVNHHAELAVPILMKSMNEFKSAWVAEFSEWDFEYTVDSRLALVFDEWWRLIEELTWDEFKGYEHLLVTPERAILLDLLVNDPFNEYFDIRNTAKIESAADIIRLAFTRVPNSYGTKYLFKWGDYNAVDFHHLTKLEGLGILDISTSGHPNAVNAVSPTWGPSVRFIVEMDADRPKAYGILPGGQSGNSASPNYGDGIKAWQSGKYVEINYYLNRQEAERDVCYSWKIKTK